MDRNYYNLLLDSYGELLTNRQIEVLDFYFKEDLSMNEIAEELGISKAGVSDIINRSIKQLDEYESKLKLVEQLNKFNALISEMSLEDNDRINKYLETIKSILRS